MLTSHVPSIIQPPPERAQFSSPIPETNSENRTANSIAMVNGVEPLTPAYSPPLNYIPPLPSSDLDAGLVEYMRLHGHSDIPLSPRQREEDDRTSVHASHAEEALPAYRADNPPRYSHSRHDSGDPMTWPAISFRIGFRTFLSPKLIAM